MVVVEFGGNCKVVGRNFDGILDFGLMQINSSYLVKLKQWGIMCYMLLNDGCMNIKVGVWFMVDNFCCYGYMWNGVGVYNVGCCSLSKKECQVWCNCYVVKIYKVFVRNVELDILFIVVVV